MYPKLLNLYGDMGNIITLKKRCEWRGLMLNLKKSIVVDSIKNHDLYFIGGSQDGQQEEVAQELYSHKMNLPHKEMMVLYFLGFAAVISF